MAVSTDTVNCICQTLGVITTFDSLQQGYKSSILHSAQSLAIESCIGSTLRIGFDAHGPSSPDSRQAFVMQLLERVPDACERLGISDSEVAR